MSKNDHSIFAQENINFTWAAEVTHMLGGYRWRLIRESKNTKLVIINYGYTKTMRKALKVAKKELKLVIS